MSFEGRTLRSRQSIASGGLLGALALLCGGIGLVDVGSTGIRALVILCLISACLLAGAIRLLASGVTVTADGLTVRELFRTTRLPWSALRAVDVAARRTYSYGHRRAEVADVERGGPYGVIRDPLALQLGRAIFYPRIHVRGCGKTIMLYPLGSFRPEPAQRRADELRELMKSHQAPPL